MYSSAKYDFKTITNEMWCTARIAFRSIAIFIININDFHNASKFDKTLFADDTLLTIADKNPLVYYYNKK